MAIMNDHFEMLKWLVDHGFSMDDSCRFGRLDMLQWAVDHGLPQEARPNICKYAAARGNLEVVKWARAHGFEWSEGTCQMAACNGHLDVLQYARSNGCAWGKGVCEAAARKGHLAVIKWAVQSGCEWSPAKCALNAVYGKQLDVVRWIADNGHAWNPQQCKTGLVGMANISHEFCYGEYREYKVFMEASNKRLELLNWLLAHGCTFDVEIFKAAVELGYVGVIRRALNRTQEKPLDIGGSAINAAREGHLDVLFLLKQNRCAWNYTKLYEAAKVRDQQHVMKWVEEIRPLAGGCCVQ